MASTTADTLPVSQMKENPQLHPSRPDSKVYLQHTHLLSFRKEVCPASILGRVEKTFKTVK